MSKDMNHTRHDTRYHSKNCAVQANMKHAKSECGLSQKGIQDLALSAPDRCWDKGTVSCLLPPRPQNNGCPKHALLMALLSSPLDSGEKAGLQWQRVLRKNTYTLRGIRRKDDNVKILFDRYDKTTNQKPVVSGMAVINKCIFIWELTQTACGVQHAQQNYPGQGDRHTTR